MFQKPDDHPRLLILEQTRTFKVIRAEQAFIYTKSQVGTGKSNEYKQLKVLYDDLDLVETRHLLEATNCWKKIISRDRDQSSMAKNITLQEVDLNFNQLSDTKRKLLEDNELRKLLLLQITHIMDCEWYILHKCFLL